MSSRATRSKTTSITRLRTLRAPAQRRRLEPPGGSSGRETDPRAQTAAIRRPEHPAPHSSTGSAAPESLRRRRVTRPFSPPRRTDQDRQRPLLWLQGARGRRGQVPQPRRHSSYPNRTTRDVTAWHRQDPGRHLTNAPCVPPHRLSAPGRRADDHGQRLRHEPGPTHGTHWYRDIPGSRLDVLHRSA